MSDNENLNIREIINRFQNSADVVEDLKTRLQSLASTDDLHTESFKATQTASQALQDLGTELHAAVTALRDTLTTADTTLTTAKTFLEATDLGEVATSLSALSTDQAGLSETVQKLSSEQNDLKESLAAEFDRVTEILTKQLTESDQKFDEARSKLAAAELELTAKIVELSTARKAHDEAVKESATLTKELDSLRGKAAMLPQRHQAKLGI